VLADPSGIHTLLQNLVSNALKYGDAERPVVHIAAEREGEHWRVTVIDNGHGVTATDQDRIFAAFQRLPRVGSLPGTGLGLAICKRVVDRAGGEIGVEAAPGGGSCFWVRLRAAD
jgi:signal transduction histidine kinase